MTTIDVETLELKAGAHKNPVDGMCLLEFQASVLLLLDRMILVSQAEPA